MALGTSQGPQPITTPIEALGGKEFQSFIRSLFRYKDSSNYPYNKRVFITLCEPVRPKFLYGVADATLNFDVENFSRSGSLFITPLRTSLTGSFHEEVGSFKTNNLAELSTFEAVGFQHINTLDINGSGNTNKVFSFIPSPKFELNQQYINKFPDPPANDLGDNPQGPFNFASGSYVISLCEDDNPSLMVELAKDSELPDGVGEKEFIVIPENLHPHIKDNLLFYLSKAGVDVSGNATDKLEKDTSKETLPPRLGYLEQLARNRRRLGARSLATNLLSPREQRQRERRRKRSERRDNRQERREERRENRQQRRADRRENRQENRQDRRENRQNRRENRQNRRENRRNRRRRR